MTIRYELANHLKQLRQRNEWTQEQVAQALDISIPAYSKMETGITDLNLSRLEQLADLYRISLSELLTGKKPVTSENFDHTRDLLAKRDQQVTDLRQKITELYHLLQS